jgi:hypothetical protein
MPGTQPPQPYQYPPPPPPASPPKHSMFVKVLSTLLGLLVAAAVTQIVNVEWHVAEVGGGVSRLQAQQLLVRYYAAVVNPNTQRQPGTRCLPPGPRRIYQAGCRNSKVLERVVGSKVRSCPAGQREHVPGRDDLHRPPGKAAVMAEASMGT